MSHSRIMPLLVLLLLCQAAYANEPSPVPGGACAEPGATFNYSTDIVKTPWKLNELYAAPVGTIDPTTWELDSTFRAQFKAELQSGEGAQAFAQACANVWRNFFTGSVDVMVTAARIITTTHVILECVSGTWVTLSTDHQEFNDVSDLMIPAGSPYDVSNQESITILESDLQNILATLNAQPGAASDQK